MVVVKLGGGWGGSEEGVGVVFGSMNVCCKVVRLVLVL